jgi:hypothetical protein
LLMNEWMNEWMNINDSYATYINPFLALI